MLRIYLTGDICLTKDGNLLRADRLPGRQGRLVFAHLASERPRTVSRDELGQAHRKRGAFAGFHPLAAWEHLIPGGKARRLAVDDHLQFASITHRIAARRTARHRVANSG